MSTLKETFLKIKNECKIPLRTVQHYVHLGLLPHPEMEGRTGSYDLEETKIIERAKIIQLLKGEFGLSLKEILKWLGRIKNEELPIFLDQLERFVEKFKLKIDKKIDEQVVPIYSDKSAVARRWFLDIVYKEGVLNEAEYKFQVGSLEKMLSDSDIVKAALIHYCMDVRK